MAKTKKKPLDSTTRKALKKLDEIMGTAVPVPPFVVKKPAKKKPLGSARGPLYEVGASLVIETNLEPVTVGARKWRVTEKSSSWWYRSVGPSHWIREDRLRVAPLYSVGDRLAMTSSDAPFVVHAVTWGHGAFSEPWWYHSVDRRWASERMLVRLREAVAAKPEERVVPPPVAPLPPKQEPPPKPDSQKEIAEICDAVKAMLLEKNRAYGDSALDPVRIFSKADPVEQIHVRIDDKLSRLARGTAAGEDVINDLLGYFVLLKIAMKRQKDAGFDVKSAVMAAVLSGGMAGLVFQYMKKHAKDGQEIGGDWQPFTVEGSTTVDAPSKEAAGG